VIPYRGPHETGTPGYPREKGRYVMSMVEKEETDPREEAREDGAS